MRAYDSVHGMNPVITELAADAGELERSLQEGLAHGLALLVPVFVAIVALIITDGIKCIPAAGIYILQAILCTALQMQLVTFPKRLRQNPQD